MASKRTKTARFYRSEERRAIKNGVVEKPTTYICQACKKASGGTHDGLCRDCNGQLLKEADYMPE